MTAHNISNVLWLSFIFELSSHMQCCACDTRQQCMVCCFVYACITVAVWMCQDNVFAYHVLDYKAFTFLDLDWQARVRFVLQLHRVHQMDVLCCCSFFSSSNQKVSWHQAWVSDRWERNASRSGLLVSKRNQMLSEADGISTSAIPRTLTSLIITSKKRTLKGWGGTILQQGCKQSTKGNVFTSTEIGTYTSTRKLCWYCSRRSRWWRRRRNPSSMCPSSSSIDRQ